MNRLYLKSLDDIQKVADEFLVLTKGKTKFAFFASMGAGKTTFIKALCHQLGVVSNVTSPTFSIVNEYKTQLGIPVYHIDFYRIKRIQEAYDLGYENYFFNDYYCFVEWPEMIESIIPSDFVCVKIVQNDDFSRVIEF